MSSQTATQNNTRPQAGGREDCWSEGATETLIEAWGHRYLRLNRGNLRQKDWKEVADAVNSRQNGVKPQRSDMQCKNRVDTLKKRYKAEKTKLTPSKWPFYNRLDYLIGINKLKASPNPSIGVVKDNSSSSNECWRDRLEYVRLSEEKMAYKELARAILRFGEVYERTESAKQRMMMELERQRMEFTRDLEVQRMNMFIDAQLMIERSKRLAKRAPSADCALL